MPARRLEQLRRRYRALRLEIVEAPYDRQSPSLLFNLLHVGETCLHYFWIKLALLACEHLSLFFQRQRAKIVKRAFALCAYRIQVGRHQRCLHRVDACYYSCNCDNQTAHINSLQITVEIETGRPSTCQQLAGTTVKRTTPEASSDTANTHLTLFVSFSGGRFTPGE